MPHVMVHFNPAEVEQSVIDLLKKALQRIVADALSYKQDKLHNTFVKPDSVYVRQVPAHPTDVNPAPIQVEIQAGQKRGRDEMEVNSLIEDEICATGIIPPHILDRFQCCIWLRFSEDNNFRFIDSLSHKK